MNYHIGNFEKNVAGIESEVRKAEDAGAGLVVFSELAITGYPPQDLLEYSSFIEESRKALEKLAASSRKAGILIGAPTLNPNPSGKKLFNSAYFLYGGKISRAFPLVHPAGRTKKKRRSLSTPPNQRKKRLPAARSL